MMPQILINSSINVWSHYKQRILFEILLNKTEIRLYLPVSDQFGTKLTSVWLPMNWKNGEYNIISVSFINISKIFYMCVGCYDMMSAAECLKASVSCHRNRMVFDRMMPIFHISVVYISAIIAYPLKAPISAV